MTYWHWLTLAAIVAAVVVPGACELDHRRRRKERAR